MTEKHVPWIVEGSGPRIEEPGWWAWDISPSGALVFTLGGQNMASYAPTHWRAVYRKDEDA